MGARGDPIGSTLTRIRNRWSMFRDLVPLLNSQHLPSGT